MGSWPFTLSPDSAFPSNMTPQDSLAGSDRHSSFERRSLLRVFSIEYFFPPASSRRHSEFGSDFDSVFSASFSESPSIQDLQEEMEGESRREEEAKLPHNYKAILKDADSRVRTSSREELCNKLYVGVFLQNKQKRYWLDKKTNSNCFMLFARDLTIEWGNDDRYWEWLRLNEPTSDESITAAALLDVCWLDASGNFHTEFLSPGTLYEVLFVLMLSNSAYGWEFPVNFGLILPDGNKQERQEILNTQPKTRWIEILAGEFRALPKNKGEIEFYMNETKTLDWKGGLIIKGVAIRPKH